MKHFTLEFSEEPFELRLMREGKPFLRVQAPYSVDEMRAHGARVLRVTFLETPVALVVETFDDRVQLRWTGQAVVNQLPLDAPWYGQGELIHQHWPLNKVMLAEAELLTIDNGPTGLLCIQTPAWLAASGVTLLARSAVSTGLNQPPADAPRFAWDLGGGQGPFDQRPALDPGGQGDGQLTLRGDDLAYDLLIADDLPGAHAALIAEVGHPAAIPPRALFERPIWTTWARYKDMVNQDVVLGFAREIVEQGFPRSVLEIDDRWQVYYGDLDFDPARFPDPRGMVETLHDLGFQVSVWTMPFLDPHSQAAREGAERGYLVRRADGSPYPVKWWQGVGYLLDATHPEALEWFGARLRALQARTGLDGFKFDAGEATFLPADGVTHAPLASRNAYTHRYVDWVSRNFSLTEVRSGWLNQRAPIFFRLWDETSNWTYANGLRSVIPSALALSVTGYPFVLPDMVGGNAYFNVPEDGPIHWVWERFIRPQMEHPQTDNAEAWGSVFEAVERLPRFVRCSPHFGYPTAELMIRWTEANALLPAMQFSLAPWEFGEECADICRRYAELHETLAPRILRWAEEAARAGAPIIRPLWWLAPHDPRAWACDDQFLVGEEFLAAPALYEAQPARDIFFPAGTWRDYWSGQTFTGPALVERYPAPLEVLPLFERV